MAAPATNDDSGNCGICHRLLDEEIEDVPGCNGHLCHYLCTLLQNIQPHLNLKIGAVIEYPLCWHSQNALAHVKEHNDKLVVKEELVCKGKTTGPLPFDVNVVLTFSFAA